MSIRHDTTHVRPLDGTHYMCCLAWLRLLACQGRGRLRLRGEEARMSDNELRLATSFTYELARTKYQFK